MARCGCSGTCSCSLAAGTGVTITGNGSSSNPYVISAGGSTMDCETVQDCIGAALGPGLEYDDAGNEIRLKLSTAAGNASSIDGSGGLYTAGGGGGGGLTFVSTQDTNCIDLSGQGTPGVPLQAAPILNSAAGQLLSCTATGLRAALTVGACGLSGNGSAASPLSARVGTWPYACPVDANAGGVYCDSTGTLRSEPRGRTFYDQQHIGSDFANLTVPTGVDNVILTRVFPVTNPDPCREMFCLFEIECDIDFNLPANSGAAGGIATDEMQYFANRGSSGATDVHCQVTKVYNRVIPAGGTLNEPMDVSMGRGSGGATYNRVQTFIRCFGIIV